MYSVYDYAGGRYFLVGSYADLESAIAHLRILSRGSKIMRGKKRVMYQSEIS